MKKLIIIFVIICLIGGGYYYYKNKIADKSAQQLKQLQKFAIVKRGDLTVIVNSTGIIEPNNTVDVKSKASGEIITLPFDEGAYVKKGELLLELDPSDENRSLTRAVRFGYRSSAAFKRKKQYRT